jgi:cell division protease FtsH
MEISYWIKKYMLLICMSIIPHSLLFSYTPDNIPLSEEDATLLLQAAEQRQDILEDILKQIIGQLSAIDIIFEDLALDVQSNVIATANQDALIAEITKIRIHLNHIKDNAFSEITEFHLDFLLKFVGALLNHLDQALQNKFYQLPPFQPVLVKGSPADVEIPNLYEQVSAHSRKLARIQENAAQAGLSWYNKTYRAFDRTIVKPIAWFNKEYEVSKWAGTGTALGLAGLYVAYHSESENKLLRKIMGWAPRLVGNALDMEYHADHPLKLIGHIEHSFIKHNIGHMPLLQLAVPIIYASSKSRLDTLSKYIKKKISAAINKLKGGEYRARTDGVSQMEITVTFDDLVGCEHAKNIARTILKYIEDADRFARKNLVPEKGYLLYGKTRTGKSEFAKAMCGEIKLLLERMGRPKEEFKFFEIKTSTIIEKGIPFIMALAEECAPCVLFIDEIDLLGLQRAGGNPQMLSDFLSTMSGAMVTDPKKQVIILASTNKPESIDESMRQRGRFGKAIYFDYPTFEYRKEFLIRRLSGLSVNINAFDINKIALETDGCSYEDLNAMIKGAFQKAKMLGIALNQEQLELSFDEEIRNILMVDDKNITDKEKAIIAAYQAGVVLSYILLQSPYHIAQATIRPIVPKLKEEYLWMNNPKDAKPQDPIEYGKVFVYREEDTLNLGTKHDNELECKKLLAGSIAQEILLNTKSSNYRAHDKKQAFTLARAIVCDNLDIEQMPKAIKNELLTKAYALLQQYEQELTQLFKEHQDLLKKVAHALQNQLSLTGDEIHAIVQKHISG